MAFSDQVAAAFATPKASAPKASSSKPSTDWAAVLNASQEAGSGKQGHNVGVLGHIFDILSRPLYGVTNVVDTMAHGIHDVQTGEKGQGIKEIAESATILPSFFQGLGGSVDDEHHKTTSQVIDDIETLSGHDPKKDSTGVRIAKAIGGFAGDVALDPLTYIPGVDVVNWVKDAAKGIRGGVDAAKAAKDVTEGVGEGEAAVKGAQDLQVQRGVRLPTEQEVPNVRVQGVPLQTMVNMARAGSPAEQVGALRRIQKYAYAHAPEDIKGAIDDLDAGRNIRPLGTLDQQIAERPGGRALPEGESIRTFTKKAIMEAFKSGSKTADDFAAVGGRIGQKREVARLVTRTLKNTDTHPLLHPAVEAGIRSRAAGDRTVNAAAKRFADEAKAPRFSDTIVPVGKPQIVKATPKAEPVEEEAAELVPEDTTPNVEVDSPEEEAQAQAKAEDVEQPDQRNLDDQIVAKEVSGDPLLARNAEQATFWAGKGAMDADGLNSLKKASDAIGRFVQRANEGGIKRVKALTKPATPLPFKEWQVALNSTPARAFAKVPADVADELGLDEGATIKDLIQGFQGAKSGTKVHQGFMDAIRKTYQAYANAMKTPHAGTLDLAGNVVDDADELKSAAQTALLQGRLQAAKDILAGKAEDAQAILDVIPPGSPLHDFLTDSMAHSGPNGQTKTFNDLLKVAGAFNGSAAFETIMRNSDGLADAGLDAFASKTAQSAAEQFLKGPGGEALTPLDLPGGGLRKMTAGRKPGTTRVVMADDELMQHAILNGYITKDGKAGVGQINGPAIVPAVYLSLKTMIEKGVGRISEAEYLNESIAKQIAGSAPGEGWGILWNEINHYDIANAWQDVVKRVSEMPELAKGANGKYGRMGLDRAEVMLAHVKAASKLFDQTLASLGYRTQVGLGKEGIPARWGDMLDALDAADHDAAVAFIGNFGTQALPTNLMEAMRIASGDGVFRYMREVEGELVPAEVVPTAEDPIAGIRAQLSWSKTKYVDKETGKLGDIPNRLVSGRGGEGMVEKQKGVLKAERDATGKVIQAGARSVDVGGLTRVGKYTADRKFWPGKNFKGQAGLDIAAQWVADAAKAFSESSEKYAQAVIADDLKTANDIVGSPEVSDLITNFSDGTLAQKLLAAAEAHEPVKLTAKDLGASAEAAKLADAAIDAQIDAGAQEVTKPVVQAAKKVDGDIEDELAAKMAERKARRPKASPNTGNVFSNAMRDANLDADEKLVTKMHDDPDMDFSNPAPDDLSGTAQDAFLGNTKELEWGNKAEADMNMTTLRRGLALLNRGQGLDDVMHQKELQFSSIWYTLIRGIAKQIRPINKLANTPEQVEKLKQAFKNLQAGLPADAVEDAQVSQFQTMMAPLVNYIFDGGEKGLLGNAFATTGAAHEGASIPHLESLMHGVTLRNGKSAAEQFLPSPEEIEKTALARYGAATDLAKSMVYRDWWKNIAFEGEDASDPLEFLMSTSKVFSEMIEHQSIANTAINRAKELGAVSTTPKEGWVKFIGSQGGNKTIFGHYFPDDLYFEPHVAQQIQRLDTVMNSHLSDRGAFMSAVKNYYMPVLDIWRTGMTVVNPSHLARNTLSDLMLTHLAEGVRNYRKAANTTMRIMREHGGQYADYDLGRMTQALADQIPHLTDGTSTAWRSAKHGEITLQQIRDGARDRGLIMDYHRQAALDELGGDEASTGLARTWADKIRESAPARIGGKLNEFSGHFTRMHQFTQNLMNNADKYATLEEAMDAAAKKVRQWHPDGSDLTNVEQRLRLVIPFYAWTRKALPRIVEATLTNPARVNAYNKASFAVAYGSGVNPDSLGDPWPETSLFPSYLTESGYGPQFQINGMQFRIDPGVPTWDVLDSVLPQTTPGGGPAGVIGSLFRNVMGQTSPFLKDPVELATGNSLSTGGDINDWSDWLDQQIPGVSQVSRLTGTSVTGTLGSALSGDPTLDQPYQVQRGNISEAQKVGTNWANWLTGLSIQPVNQQNQINYAEIEARNAAGAGGS